MGYTARTANPVDGTEQSMLRVWTMTVISPIQSVIGSIFSTIGSGWTGYIDLRGVAERNEQLQADNDRMRAEIESARAASAENERLRQMLELKPLLKYDSVVAEVVARDASVWFKRITINKGTLAGIQLDQPVVTPAGLVGRVTAVGPNVAQVQLITDEHAGVGGRLSLSRAAGELKGKGDGFCRFKSISSLQEVGPGERIVTSGLDRIYPAGILIGSVESVTPGAGASPHDITVRPSTDLDRIEEVMVLKVKPEDLTVVETIK